MPRGDLLVQITDMAGWPVSSKLEIELKPEGGAAGAGGAHMSLGVKMGGSTDLVITGIHCQGGAGTLYRVRVEAANFRPYTFVQNIREKQVSNPTDDVELWAQHDRVKSIAEPAFADLKPAVRRVLEKAQMLAVKAEDKDLAGLAGANLYSALGPPRQAGLLNIVAKAAHGSAAKALDFVRGVVVARQDRFFALVDEDMLRLVDHDRYRSAQNTLHEPLPGFEMARLPSIKTDDARANLQITFMRNTATGALAADIDIDESSGFIRHGFEVIRNTVKNQRTNPYLIREFLLAADREKSLFPGYGFGF